jgi:RNase adapter protein RapZ
MDSLSTGPQKLRIVLISGLSGAGKTLSLKTLEDHDYFAIDNLPASLIDPLALLLEQQHEITKVALVMDGRDPAFLAQAPAIVKGLQAREHNVAFFFLDASREILIRRFAESRRPHPLARKGPVAEGIEREQKLLEPLRKVATKVLDTSATNVHELRRMIIDAAEPQADAPLHVYIASFGYKYGVPLEAAFVFDIRYLPNPFFVEALRRLTGQEEDVADYVFASPEATTIRDQLLELVRTVLPLCRREGRNSLMVAVGCTGGQHRSVAMAEAIGATLKSEGVELEILHRDVTRNLGAS